MRTVPPGPRQSLILARDRDATGRKEYTRMASLHDAVRLIGATPDAAYYEHAADAPCVVYFDIDRKSNDDPAPVLATNMAWIRELLGESGYGASDRDVRVLDGCRPGKVSFHVLVRNLYLRGDAGRAALQCAIRARLAVVASDVDAAPYGRNGLFRTPLSSKMGVSTPLRPVGGHPVHEYMITYVPETAAPLYDAATPTPVSARTRCDGDSTHSVAVVRAVRKAGDACSELRSVEEGVYYFTTRRSRVCLLAAGVNHSSNNFCVTVGGDGGMVYKCFSVRCARQTLLLGYVDAVVAAGSEWERGVRTHRYTEERSEPIEMEEGLTLLRAPMGTGKTFQLRELIRSMGDDRRVLVVSFRVSLCQYMHGYLGCDFELYSDHVGELRAHPRLIVTVNSLGRLVGAAYDLIVMDESESILEQFDGVHPVHMRMAWLVFEKLVRDTPRVLCMDAAIGPRTYYVMRSLQDRVRLVVNEVVPTASRRTIVVVAKDPFLSELLRALRASSRVAVASTSASQLTALHAALVAAFPTKRFYLIHAGTSEAEKKLFARRCNDILRECDGLFYSPTIQAGNSIDVPFDELFVYATPSGPTPEGVHQMMGRVRTLTTGRVYVTFDRTPTVDQREYTFAEITEHLTNPLERMHAGMALGRRFGETWRLEFERSPLFVLTVWNTMYRVNGYQNFAPRFMRLCSDKGYEVRRQGGVECSDGAALRQLVRDTVERTNEERNAEVVAAPVLDAAAYTRLRQQLKIPTDERKLGFAVERFEFCTHYNIAPRDLTVAMLRKYARPAKRGAYHRLCLMLPADGARGGDAVRTRIDAVLRAEGALLADAGDVIYTATNLPRTNGVRLRYAHQLLVDLGFDSAFDSKRLDHETVDRMVVGLVPMLVEHVDAISSVFLTPARRRDGPVAAWETADAVRYVNQCIRALLGVYVRRSRSGYKLVGTGAWDGAVPLRSADLDGGEIFG